MEQFLFLTNCLMKKPWNPQNCIVCKLLASSPPPQPSSSEVVKDETLVTNKLLDSYIAFAVHNPQIVDFFNVPITNIYPMKRKSGRGPSAQHWKRNILLWEDDNKSKGSMALTSEINGDNNKDKVKVVAWPYFWDICSHQSLPLQSCECEEEQKTTGAFPLLP